MSQSVTRSVVESFWDRVFDSPDAPAFAEVANGQVEWLSWRELGWRVWNWIHWLRQTVDERVAHERATHERATHTPAVHVASCLPNSLAWILLDLAVQTLSWVHVAIDVREPLTQQQALSEFSQASAVVDTQRLAELASAMGCQANAPSDFSEQAVRLCLARLDPDTPAQMLFTSGSAGLPKGVLLSHRNLLASAVGKLDAAPQFPDDLRLNGLPFAHAYARTCELSAWILSGSRLAIARDWESLLSRARCLRPTLINLVPYWAERLADLLEREPAALGGRLRLLQVGGAALSEELWQRLARLGLPPLQGYGLTEAAPVVCSNRTGLQRPGSVGPAVAGVELRLDEAGVLWCRGANVMLGYWRNASATAASVVDGWLCTGDLAVLGDDGYVSILGRASQQLVLSTGYKVCPESIERELCRLDGVQHALVCGTGRPYVVALLWPSSCDSASAPGSHSNRAWPELIEAQLSRFPKYARPRRVQWSDQPLNAASGWLTSKGTLRRPEIIAHYAAQIDALYR